MSLLQVDFCQGAGFEGAEKWIHLQDRTPIHKKQAPTCLHPRLEALTMKELRIGTLNTLMSPKKGCDMAKDLQAGVTRRNPAKLQLLPQRRDVQLISNCYRTEFLTIVYPLR